MPSRLRVVDPGPDGRPGSADDGATVTAYDLTPEALDVPSVNLTTNLPDSDSDYYTWEITATKRQSARWSLLASFTKTWNREAALSAGNDFTPNALVNATGRQLRFTTWQAKLYATIESSTGYPAGPRRPVAIGNAVRSHVRSHTHLRQRDDQGGTDRRQSDPRHRLIRPAD